MPSEQSSVAILPCKYFIYRRSTKKGYVNILFTDM